MDNFHKVCHVLYSINVYEEDDVDMRVFDNNIPNIVVHDLDIVEAQYN